MRERVGTCGGMIVVLVVMLCGEAIGSRVGRGVRTAVYVLANAAAACSYAAVSPHVTAPWFALGGVFIFILLSRGCCQEHIQY